MSSQSSIGDSDKENNTPTTLRIQDIQKSKKRVLFSPLPALLQPSVESKPDHLKLPQRSVLKVGTNSSSPFSSPIYEKEDPSRTNLDYMIESAIQSLSGHDRPSKIETYATLSNLFRTFENIPDRTKLFLRLPELFGLIAADVVRTSEDDLALPDYPLNTKALKIAGFLLFDRDISAAVPARLSKTLMEHSLTRMEAEKVTKATSTQFLWLWQTQHLPRAIVTADIAERILHATIKAEFPSLIINQERMSVFLRLLDQSREVMVKNIDSWLPRVINYLLDDNKQIRTAALRTALEAGRTLCRVPSVGRCVQNHLRSEVNGQAYIEISSERFKKIMQEPDGGIYVAHAWGAICTLSSSQNPEKSKSLMAWMHVLQIVFNSSATENKIMAQSAWVRMIHYFGNNGDIIYREKNLAYLTKPICRMLSTEVKVYDTVRMAAVNTANALLYAVNKPGVSAEQTSAVWHEVVKPVATSLLQSFQKEPLQQRAVDLLATLFDFKPVEPWTLSRLLDDRIVHNKDISHLDSRWVRAHINELAPVIVLALQSAASEESKLNLWTILQKSLRHAGAKEVQISAELMEATATICTVFRSLWTAPLPQIGSPSNKPQEDISRRVAFVTALILSTFETLGTSSFTEKTLSFVDGSDIVPAQTPSMSEVSKAGHGTGLTFVYKLFQTPAHEIMVDANYIDMLESITTRCLSSQKSVRKCMNLLMQCMSTIELEKSKLPVQSWKILAEVATLQIQSEVDKSVLRSPSKLRHIEFDQAWVNAKSILETGLRLQYGPAFPEWLLLTEILVKAVRNQMDYHAANIHVLEPLSSLLLETECLQIEYVQSLVSLVKAEPQDINMHLAAEVANAELDLDEVPSLAKLVAASLVTLEAKWKRYQLSEEPLEHLSSVAEFVTQLQSSQVERLVSIISKGITKWAARSHEGADKLILAVLQAMRRCQSIQASSLESCESIFTACWISAHSGVREQATETWNQTFGKLSRLEYSTDFVAAVKKADLPIGSLILPTWPEQDPELDRIAESSTTIVIDPPKMNALTAATVISGDRARSRTRSISRSGGQARRSSRGRVLEEHVSPVKNVLKKRKRRDTGSKTNSIDGSSPQGKSLESDGNQPINVIEDAVVEDASTPSRKRQKRSDKQTTTQSPNRRERRATRASVSQEDDAFGSQDSKTFLLSKRTLRATSPQLGSDQISEISPSVASRVRKLSSSAEPPIMQDLRPLSPSVDGGLVVLQDEMDDEFENQDSLVKREDELSLHTRPARPPNSDDLMQIQIHDHEREQVTAIDTIETLQESIDEDLFILQLQQYRESLKQGRPITPRRRKTLGILMQEITKLSRDVTDMYFSP